MAFDKRSSFLTISPEVFEAPLAEPVSPCTGATETAWDIILQEVARAPMRFEKPGDARHTDKIHRPRVQDAVIKIKCPT